MTRTAEVIVVGLLFPEGPVWCGDGTVVCTSVAEGALYRVWPTEGRKERIASVGGGANAAAPADDGGFLVTQNGGIDFGSIGLYEDPPPYRPVRPGVQRVAGDGSVSYLLDVGFLAPNDLVVAADGTLYFTDRATCAATSRAWSPSPMPKGSTSPAWCPTSSRSCQDQSPRR